MQHTAKTRQVLFTAVLLLLLTACETGESTGQGATTPPARSTARPRGTVTPRVTPSTTPTQPQGSAAITPSGSGAQALTESDVRSYLQQHPAMPFAQPESTVTIDSVSFLPSRVVQTTLHG